MLGLAQTGTGKTAAFVLPILQRLLDSRGRGRGPRALIVTPTRELASQVHAELERLARHTPVTATVVFGGVPIPRQVRVLRGRVDVLVACPGRLLDLLGRKALRLDGVEVLVLDEADHMFDMGFLPDVRRILRALPTRRQNLLFSATMPSEIRGLADSVLERPAVVELGHSRPAETIAHALYPLVEGDKIVALETLFAGDDFRSAIVFLRTKRRTKRLAKRLGERGHAAVALEGNMSQAQRERALRGFREERYDVLVATDVAARGLDIAGVSHVVNFDVPTTPDAYTHRIGRTGRSEHKGTALTFVTPADAAAVRAIEQRLGAAIERRRLVGIEPDRRGASEAAGPRSSRRRRRAATAPSAPRRRGTERSQGSAASPALVAVASRAPGRAAFGQGVLEASAPERGSGRRRHGGASRPRRGRRRRG